MRIYMLYMERFPTNLKHALIRKVITCWHELLYKFCFCGEKLLGLSFYFLTGTSYIRRTNFAAFAHKAVIYSSSGSVTTYHPRSTIYSAAQPARRITQRASYGATICSAPFGMTFLFLVYFRTHKREGKCFSSCEEIQVITGPTLSHRVAATAPSRSSGK